MSRKMNKIRMRSAKRILPVGVLLSLFLLAGCANNAQRGALIGAAVGGSVDGERGAFVGGVTGYMIGNEMDKQDQGGNYRHHHHRHRWD